MKFEYSPVTSVGVVHFTWPSQATSHVHATNIQKVAEEEEEEEYTSHIDAM